MSRKVFCYYCDAAFFTEDQLISHQKTKHFRCPVCNHVKGSAKSLAQHMTEIHKSFLTAIPNAIEGRQDPSVNVFGLSGIPEDVYVSWLAAIDPNFKNSIKNVNMQGSYLASQAVVSAALQSSEKTHNVIRDQLFQFQKAKIQVAPTSTNKIITSKGVISSDSLSKVVSTPLEEKLQNAQRLFEASMRKAEQILYDAEKDGEKRRKQKTKERRKKEVLYFTPDDEGRSVYEMRAFYLQQKNQTKG